MPPREASATRDLTGRPAAGGEFLRRREPNGQVWFSRVPQSVCDSAFAERNSRWAGTLHHNSPRATNVLIVYNLSPDRVSVTDLFNAFSLFSVCSKG